jgi:membrane associated rhomboid family serine protease
MPNLTGLLAGFQAAVWFLSQLLPGRQGQNTFYERFLLDPAKVWDGEVWRLGTFVCAPPGLSLWAIFGIYLFWVMGSALEAHWGTVRSNLYVLLAVLSSIGAAFLSPLGGPGNSAFIDTSVFLAFAYLYPDFTLSIYFLLPIRIKWLALLTWLGYAWVMINGDWALRVYVLASVGNFLLFFADDLWRRWRLGKRSMTGTIRKLAEGNKAFHTCVVCGLTEHDDPQEDFRICSNCTAGTFEYCSRHLRNHEHHQRNDGGG